MKTLLSPPASCNTQSRPTRYALVGNPNCGKTSIFNQLTGLRQKTANYPGVTVEAKIGYCFNNHGQKLEIIDLPGAYSLEPQSLDELIFQQVICGQSPHILPPEAIIMVLDATRLERGLYLVQQIASLQIPMIIVLTMIEKLRDQKIIINKKALSEAFNCPVILYTKAQGLLNLKVNLSHTLSAPTSLDIPPSATIQDHQQAIKKIIPSIIDTSQRQSIYHTLDNIFLHPVFGWFFLVSILAGMFWSIFELSSYPMQGIEWCFTQIINFIENILPVSQTRNLLTQGILTGIGNILMFVPQILILFLFIGILESTGYLPRAVFLMDGIMRRVGLQGKSFIPLLSSYGCAIPGIMATRTLHSTQERIATILIAPWMSCSARLPIYLLLISTLMPSPKTPSIYKASLLITIYITGTTIAFFTAWIFRKTFLQSKRLSSSTFELPPYQLPSISNIAYDLWDRTCSFIQKAGSFILAFSIFFWFLTNYPQKEGLSPSEHLQQSFAGQLGRQLEPLFKPLGYDWKIDIGILSSFAARELFVSTMGILYSVENTAIPAKDCGCGCCDSLGSNRSVLASILINQYDSSGKKIYTPLTCLSLIVFYMFALQCTSTIAVVKRETRSWKWPLFQFIFMTFFAYLAALLIYQSGLYLGYS